MVGNSTQQIVSTKFDAGLNLLSRDPNERSRTMTEYYPHTVLTGVLSFVFVRKLCERLEREKKLAAGETVPSAESTAVA